MKNLLPIGFVFLLIASFNCKNTNNSNPKENPGQNLAEIITKTYSVKIVDGNVVKDTVNMIQSYIYNMQSEEIANIYYNLDGTVSWKDEYKFDKNGYKIGSNYYDKGSILTSYYEYQIDSLGRRVYYKALDINTDTLLYDGSSKYENNGKLRKDGFINSEGKFKWNFEYQFDENGKELGYTYIDLRTGKRFPSKYTYTKFNDKGKWTERQISEANKIQNIEIREFKFN